MFLYVLKCFADISTTQIWAQLDHSLSSFVIIFWNARHFGALHAPPWLAPHPEASSSSLQKKLDFVEKSGISTKMMDFSCPRTKNLDFGGWPLCALCTLKSRFFAIWFCQKPGFRAKKIGNACKKAGFHRCLKSHFFAIPIACGRPRRNPWKMTLKSNFCFAEIQLFYLLKSTFFARNPAFFCKTRWRGPCVVKCNQGILF